LAREWGPDGIRVNAVTPLAMTPALLSAERHDPALAVANRRRTVLGRVGDPLADIGPTVVHLVGPGSRYVTGQNIFVNGGAHMSG
jgi:NAD(P)-dependent dehydrogenase (short-subunit alcohol dehydrogenase family)